MKKIFVLIAVIILIALFQYCNNSPQKHGEEVKTAKADTAGITPVPLPNPQINGFRFPEDSNTINSWLKKNDTNNLTLHSWGIWTALTMNSGQTYNGEALKVFETWFTPEDIAAAIIAKKQNKSFTETLQARKRGMLKTPHQFIHAKQFLGEKLTENISPADSSRILGFVKYDPSAAEFTINNALYDSATLQKMFNAGQTAIPDFPNTSITTKPVFEIITRSSLENGFYKLKVWSGPPPQPIPYGESKWPGCIYVDPNNKGQGNGSIDIGCKGRTPQTTYNVNDFIHFSLDESTAQSLKANFNITANQGDVAILVAMHVTSREIRRWTWQTFWWAPNADTPPAPSSSSIAAVRPQQLAGAPRHYAMSIAYTFINPDQPFTGGNNIGTSIYAFNPYLEAGFSRGVFYQTATVITNGKTITNDVGVRTNCMSCHALANFNPGNSVPTGPGYMADTYIDMEGKRFAKVLKLDFLWSIAGNIISDGSTEFIRTNKVRPLNFVKSQKKE
jgi:hypothetical protein